MRYALNIWKDELYSHEVKGTNRRQDEPHDGFAGKGFLKCSFDAWIQDEENKNKSTYIQLKSHTLETDHYVDGIRMVSNIFPADMTESKKIKTMIEGLEQMHGLLDEVITNVFYRGKDDVVTDHLTKIDAALATTG